MREKPGHKCGEVTIGRVPVQRDLADSLAPSAAAGTSAVSSNHCISPLASEAAEIPLF
jgi:hypothetical protein